MSGKIILDPNENEYTFQRDDALYKQMTAYINEKPVASVPILVTVAAPEPPDYEEPQIIPETTGSFPYGTSADNFVLICQAKQEYSENLNIDDLNTYTRKYLEDVGANAQEYDPKVTYFFKEGNNIYTYLKIPKEEANNYGNEEPEELQDANSNTTICKVYVKGYAEIIGYQLEENRNQEDFGIRLSPGYCCKIQGNLYMFILDKAHLVHLSDDKTYFYRNGEEQIEQNKKYFTSHDYLIEHGYYLFEGAKCQNLTINRPIHMTTTDEPISNNLSIPLLFDSTEIKHLVTSDTMTEIEYFANVTNASKVILSGVTKIGDYSFYRSNVSGGVMIVTPKLIEIGEYAFAGTSNLELRSDENDEWTIFPNTLKIIGDCAFKGSSGLDKIDLSSCMNLQMVGTQAFSYCGNLDYVAYTDYQIDSSGYSPLLDLPPDMGSGGNYAIETSYEGNRNKETVVTARYNYNYTEDTKPKASEMDHDSRKTFYYNDNTVWICQ